MDRGVIVSFDMACTLFWEHGCDPRYPYRPVRAVFTKILDYLAGLGYNVPRGVDAWRIYGELWRSIQDRGPWRELWHRYVLLKLLYRLGLEVDYRLLDEIYDLYISERARLFLLPPRHKKLLEYLNGLGYTLVLTTGTGAHDLPLKILELNNVSKYFKMVFSTQLIGIPKSDHRFYEEIIDTLGIEPDRMIHIGDSLEADVYSPRRAGIKTVYYGWRTMCRASDPSPCITDLWGLTDYLL